MPTPRSDLRARITETLSRIPLPSLLRRWQKSNLDVAEALQRKAITEATDSVTSARMIQRIGRTQESLKLLAEIVSGAAERTFPYSINDVAVAAARIARVTERMPKNAGWEDVIVKALFNNPGAASTASSTPALIATERNRRLHSIRVLSNLAEQLGNETAIRALVQIASDTRSCPDERKTAMLTRTPAIQTLVEHLARRTLVANEGEIVPVSPEVPTIVEFAIALITRRGSVDPRAMG